MPISKRLGFSALLAAGTLVGVLSASPARASYIDDPLHGFCNGSSPAGACVDNGTNTPLGNSTTFGFNISPGPQTGDLTLVALIPNNISFTPTTLHESSPTPQNIAFTAVPGTWTSGDLATFLGISASPDNPIGAFLPTTNNFFDPTATGYHVFLANTGTQTIAANPAAGPPVFDQINGQSGGSALPLGSYLVAFCRGSTAGGDCTVGGPSSTTEVATANSGALLVNGTTRVPEPASLALFGTALAGLGLMRRRRNKA